MNITDQIQQLHQLHVGGVLSDEEFAQAKQAVLTGNRNTGGEKADKLPPSLRAHLMRPTAPRPASTPASAKQGLASPYGPVSPRLATLEPSEKHLHTFTLSPYVFKEGAIFPPRLPAWYPDNTRFLWHLTDSRIVVEPSEMGKTEEMVMKGVIALGNQNLGGKIGGMAARQDWEAGREQMEKLKTQWCVIPYEEIATVELMKVNLNILKLVKITFNTEATQDLVVSAQEASAGVFNPWNYSSEFLGIMLRLLDR